MQQTTAHFENNPQSPALFENLSQYYIERLTKAIVGFRIEVTGIDNVCKLSQNRDQESYNNIINHLQQGDADAQTIAAEMHDRKDYVFPAT